MMKRKHGEFRQNPNFVKNDESNKSQYVGDPVLLSRINQYLKANKHRPMVSVVAMAQYLQMTYSEYQRKKKIPFQKAVERAYQFVEKQNVKKLDSQEGISKLEEKHLQKRRKQKVEELSSDDSNSFSDNEEYVEYKDKNSLNSFMAAMYKNSPHRSVSQPASRNPSAPASPHRSDLISSDSELVFMIDRTGEKSNDQDRAKAMPHGGDIKGNAPVKESKSDKVIIEESPEPKVEVSDSRKSVGETLNKSEISDRRVTSDKQEKSEETDLKVTDKKTTKMKRGKLAKKKNADEDEGKKKGAEVTKSTVTFADIGGNENTLKEICKLLVHMKHPEVYQQIGVTPPRGFLLHGPPGCGKTLLAQAVAGELDLPLIKMASTEIVSGVSGESEEKIRDVFNQALAIAPCVLFLDEIDAITPKRENASKDMERRIVSQLLSCLDDLNNRAQAQVLVIGATNRPDSIDPALRRAGRFDREISLGIPDENARMRILRVLCRELRLSADFDFHFLAHNTPGFVGADLMALSREAAMTAVNRVFHDLETKKVEKNLQKNSMCHTGDNDNIVDSIESSKPTVALSQCISIDNNSVTICKTEEAAPSENYVTKTNENKTFSSSDTNEVTHLSDQLHHSLTDEQMHTTAACSGGLDSSKQQYSLCAEHEVKDSTNTSHVTESEQNTLEDRDLKSVLTWLRDQPPLSEEELRELFITMDDFQDALKVVQPSAKREGFATIPDVTWDDIGALRDVREELQMCILGPVRHPDQFQAMGLTSPPGILLAGPPGCGKTLLAKAVANESGINFISVKGPELLNMYVGESERAVRQVFQRARNSAPCVIFFDELDALCPRRSHTGEGGSSVRVVNQLLTEMDGLEERKQVFIMAATNRPDIIDPAILRPGRLDKTLYVGLPGAEDRLDILRTLTKNGTKPKLSSQVDLHQVATHEKCKGFTGADLAALVREAAVAALREFMSNPQSSAAVIQVECKHFDLAFSKVKPSVSGKDQLVYSEMKARGQNL